MAETVFSQENCVECNSDPTLVAPVSVPSLKIEDPTNRATFTPPTARRYPMVVIEYCDKCRWLHRATWVATELSLTFPAPVIMEMTLVPIVPPEPAGRFRVWLIEKGEGNGETASLMWDRKLEDSFPELKVLKQRVRDCISPGVSLGHSDKKIDGSLPSAHTTTT